MTFDNKSIKETKCNLKPNTHFSIKIPHHGTFRILYQRNIQFVHRKMFAKYERRQTKRKKADEIPNIPFVLKIYKTFQRPYSEIITYQDTDILKVFAETIMFGSCEKTRSRRTKIKKSQNSISVKTSKIL